MKWFFRWLRNGLETLDQDNREQEAKYNSVSDRGLKIGLALNSPKVRRGQLTAGSSISQHGEVNLSQQPMHFKIYPATGGHIVEYSYYNERKDTHDQALHLIPSELDLGSELAKIMTLEALKR